MAIGFGRENVRNFSGFAPAPTPIILLLMSFNLDLQFLTLPKIFPLLCPALENTAPLVLEVAICMNVELSWKIQLSTMGAFAEIGCFSLFKMQAFLSWNKRDKVPILFSTSFLNAGIDVVIYWRLLSFAAFSYQCLQFF